MGVATLLACISMNTYLMTNKDFAYMPGTINFSSVDVFNGLIGIFPFMFGLAIFATCVLNNQFRFKDIWNSFMTMFYIMNGDTMFDTITGIRQVSFFFTLGWSYFWVWFGNNIIINITLAQVADGYSKQKAYNKNDWLLKAIKDPEYEDDETIQALDSLFVPKSLQMNNIYSRTDLNRNLLSITKMQLDAKGSHTWNYKKGIKSFLEIESYIREYRTIQSKSTLSKLLGADELGCDTP